MGKQTIQISKAHIQKSKSAHQYFLTKEHRSTIKGAHQPRVPDWWEKEVKGKGQFLVCQKCGAVYLKKHWYNNSSLAEFLKKQKNIKYSICGECALKPLSTRGAYLYEGEVLLTNLGADKEAILRLAKNVGERAIKRDPEDQILKIEDKNDSLRILTSENQLAISIGKQVAQAFKGGILKIKFSHQEEVVRVTWRHK
jgi:hypothetical protein